MKNEHNENMHVHVTVKHPGDERSRTRTFRWVSIEEAFRVLESVDEENANAAQAAIAKRKRNRN